MPQKQSTSWVKQWFGHFCERPARIFRSAEATEITLDCSGGMAWCVHARNGESYSLEAEQGRVLISESGRQHQVRAGASLVVSKPDLYVFAYGQTIGGSKLRIVGGPESLVTLFRVPAG
jgi:hypothetical protein